MVESLSYVVEDSTLAELLGKQNFSTDESAILELVKNAFDAGAQTLKIIFSNNLLTIEDNGVGMDYNDIKEYWMHVGKSHKVNKIVEFNGVHKKMAGSMGIGRFALARLGEDIELQSKKNSSRGVIWKTNWESSTIDLLDCDFQGTKIFIGNLRERWTKKRVEKLSVFLGRVYHDNVMEIILTYNDVRFPVYPIFQKPKLGINCLSSIKFSYDSKKMKLTTHIDSDEFRSEVSEIVPDVDINHASFEDDLFIEYQNRNDLIELIAEESVEPIFDKYRTDNYLKQILKDIGDFSGELYFYIKPLRVDLNRYLYKHFTLKSPIKGDGIILYRNSFSISSYEGSKDWLGIGKRSRKSPAAASHLSGAWRVRENQISGRIIIDKDENRFLKDLSNRQGLDENIYYNFFVEIIIKSISRFERYRQSIIRSLAKNEKQAFESNKLNIVDSIANKQKKLSELTDDDFNTLSFELQELRTNEKNSERIRIEKEEKYKYDVRLLNVLATIGLKSSSIAHELKNDRLTIISSIPRVIELLKNKGIWEELNSTTNKVDCIPYYLTRTLNINKKIFSFINTMLSELEVKRFNKENKEIKINIKDEIDNIQKNWERDYGRLKIIVTISEDIEFQTYSDVIQVILDNLILNSIQNNDSKENLMVNILINKDGEFLKFKYCDNGKGLNEKYNQDPMSILEVHETSRENGHGLGMWIINNTVIDSGGEITKIFNENGFNIEFYLGEK
ncbi:sensor histidine kinase [Streptococcus parasanguinis]|uniref:sensor histidine kinase n=1 Tax=Streptococcus parasanguinis TaxID=1318 RepID=UPI0012BD61FE|nr:ATP-binding protein [Streptococcus parasanguinis]MTS05982.1 ATP-binding protein [Streptococcus parasanguinis]